MDCAPSRAQRKQESPPAEACMVGGRLLSPRGTRIVAQGQMDQDGKPCWGTGIVRWLFECRTPGCLGGCGTAYEPGGQPHRRYSLEVVIAAVKLASVPGATLTGVAELLDCHRSTVARWLTQVATLGGVDKLIKLCARLDPDGLPPPSMPAVPPAPSSAALVPRRAMAKVPEACYILLLFEHYADLLRRRGLPMVAGPGLVAVLHHQYRAFRPIQEAVRGSPGKRVDPPPYWCFQ